MPQEGLALVARNCIEGCARSELRIGCVERRERTGVSESDASFRLCLRDIAKALFFYMACGLQ